MCIRDRASKGLQSKKARPILGKFLTFPDPPFQPGQIILVQNGLYRCPTYSTTVSCWTRTSGGYFWPSEVRFRGYGLWVMGTNSAKIPLYPYNVKTQKTQFLKTLSWADFDLLESNSRYIFLHKNKKFTIVHFFSLDACSRPMCDIDQGIVNTCALVV